QRRGQRVDVLAIERRDETEVKLPDDALDDIVERMFLFFQFLAAFREAIEVSDHVEESISSPGEDRCRLVEHVVELDLAGKQAETHGERLSDLWDGISAQSSSDLLRVVTIYLQFREERRRGRRPRLACSPEEQLIRLNPRCVGSLAVRAS